MSAERSTALAGMQATFGQRPPMNWLLHDGGLQSQLRSSDRGDVAAGTRADHDAVIRAFGHAIESIQANGLSGVFIRERTRTSFQNSQPPSASRTRHSATAARLDATSSDSPATITVSSSSAWNPSTAQ